MTTYFGEAWDAPCINDKAVQVRTPVGWPCYWCGIAIMPGDLGFMLPLVDYRLDTEKPTIARSYVHRECYFAEQCGHLVGVCGCTGCYATREFALLAWRRWLLVKNDQPW